MADCAQQPKHAEVAPPAVSPNQSLEGHDRIQGNLDLNFHAGGGRCDAALDGNVDPSVVMGQILSQQPHLPGGVPTAANVGGAILATKLVNFKIKGPVAAWIVDELASRLRRVYGWVTRNGKSQRAEEVAAAVELKLHELARVPVTQLPSLELGPNGPTVLLRNVHRPTGGVTKVYKADSVGRAQELPVAEYSFKGNPTQEHYKWIATELKAAPDLLK